MATLALAVVLIAPVALSGAAQPGELIERTLAIVGGQAITLADVQTARRLGLVSAADDDMATERLVERVLILREVERYAPSEPDADAVEQGLRAVRERVSKEEFDSALAAGGFTEARLRAWIRDDLRVAAYLNQRFVPAGVSGQSRTDLIADWIADLRRRTPVVELWKK